jgi:hypothetical protein
MILYHFTDPVNLLRIASGGLEPRANPENKFMTGDVPVVWLTRQDSNIATADDVTYFKVRDTEVKEGAFLFGGKARLAVELQRHDRRLIRYLDFIKKSGGNAAQVQDRISPRAAAAWWIYAGPIPRHKIDLSVPQEIALECLDFHISTHPDIEVRARFKIFRDQITNAATGQMVQFGVAHD